MQSADMDARVGDAGAKTTRFLAILRATTAPVFFAQVFFAQASVAQQVQANKNLLQVAQADAKSFNIPAQPLSRALTAFGQQSGLQVTVDSSSIAGLTSQPVSGSLSPNDALTRLFAGTGVSWRYSDSRTVVLERATASSDGTVTLPPVAVEAGIADNDRPVNGYQTMRSRTAMKTDTPLIDVPSSINVVPSEVIQDQGVRSLGDTLRYVPGTGVAQGEGNRDNPILRGNSTNSDLFVDGIRDDVEYYRDLYNIDRVEVIKGANAMIFGRGGSGGVVNRVTKQPDVVPTRQLSLQTGSWDQRRATADYGQAVSNTVNIRVNGLYENSESYRDYFHLERYGLNPVIGIQATDQTKLTLSYEWFRDDRTADRGIPSLQGRPVDVKASQFFGNPNLSYTTADVDALTAVIDHKFDNGITLRNATRFAVYEKFYQNVYPGAVNNAGTTVAINAYNNAQDRKNLFNQTDVTGTIETESIKHTMTVGMEVGRQVTENFRNTGFFSPGVTTLNVPLGTPVTYAPVSFQQSATDADNHSVATIAAVYLQDQIDLSSDLKAVLGVRFDHFNVEFRNNRNGAGLSSTDDLVSPRVGLIYKPVEDLSLYASYGVAYVPRAGAQLASLTVSNAALEPEEFRNYEVGAKWDVNPDLSLTAAVFQLDRSNVAVADPLDPTKLVLVDGQRTRGIELGATGKVTKDWSVFGGYAYQNAKITETQSATARAGANLAGVPQHTFSLWNKYDIDRKWGVGLGLIHQTGMYASSSNAVRLEGYTRVDAAVYYQITNEVRAQVNFENIFDTQYFASANNDNNITPGSPRAVYVGLTTNF